MGDDAALVRLDGKWLGTDAGAEQRSASALMSPVAGRITSRFGTRVHPIFRYPRFHSGIDFGAGWGTPIVAAADGQVVGAGWNGGYGRQVVVAHGGGVATTYSHMSSFAAEPGMAVRQGQVIGYVGSSGVSTGPHLHFEVRVGGQAVDPLSAQLKSRPAVSAEQMKAVKARVAALRAIVVKRA
jgi:murein DD-endopeptidase MepM/ murein hydrolase activator NlpD